MPKDASELRTRIEPSKLIYCASRQKTLSRVVMFGRRKVGSEQCRCHSPFMTRWGSRVGNDDSQLVRRLRTAWQLDIWH